MREKWSGETKSGGQWEETEAEFPTNVLQYHSREAKRPASAQAGFGALAGSIITRDLLWNPCVRKLPKTIPGQGILGGRNRTS